MIAAPITGDDGPLGVIEVYAVERDAFDETDADLVRALAGQAAIAITNARLIDELAASRSDLARTADAERTLREIAARVSAMRDQERDPPGGRRCGDAPAPGRRRDASTCIGAAGAGRGLDPTATTIRPASTRIVLVTTSTSTPSAGVSGLAIATRRGRAGPATTWPTSASTTPTSATRSSATSGIQSVIAAPLLQRGEVLGAITVYAERRDAFDATDAAVLAGLADQAAVAIANVRLIDELERSRAEIARRADAERTLREIAARVSAILDPADVLERIVDEAARLLDSDGARIDLWDDSSWAPCAGRTPPARRWRDVPDWGQDRRPQGRARPWPAWPSPSSAPVMTPTTSPTSASRRPGDRGLRQGAPASAP